MTIQVHTLAFTPANDLGPALKSQILLRNTAAPFTDVTELSRYISQELGNPRLRPETTDERTVRVLFKHQDGDQELLTILI